MTPKRLSVRIDAEVYAGTVAYANENHASITWALNQLLRKGITAAAREKKSS